MRTAFWTAAPLVLCSGIAAAAQGVHPGPLPPPVDFDSARAGGASDRGYGGPETFGRSFGPAVPGDPRDAADQGYGLGSDPGRSGHYPALPPSRDLGYGDRAYRPPPPEGQPTPRGYWQWVPDEAAGPGPYGSAPAAPSYRGFTEGYPLYGYPPSPYEGRAEPYHGGSAPPAYRGFDETYPDRGPATRYLPDTRSPPGYAMPPPSGGREAQQGGFSPLTAEPMGGPAPVKP